MSGAAVVAMLGGMKESKKETKKSGKDENDFSDKFNTKLSPKEEKEYQEWAKENNREKDVYDYDLRGARKELKSGSMSEDERGHLGDKYKKPNHITFSDQSIYASEPGATPGRWSKRDGKDVYTPGRQMQGPERERLSRYFDKFEPNAILDME